MKKLILAALISLGILTLIIGLASFLMYRLADTFQPTQPVFEPTADAITLKPEIPNCLPYESAGAEGLVYYKTLQPMLLLVQWKNYFDGQPVPIILKPYQAITFVVPFDGTIDVKMFCEPDGPQTYLASPTTVGIADVNNETLIREGLITIK